MGSGRRRRSRPDRPLRVGVVGCGYWGPQIIRNFNEMPAAELVAVADMRPERRDYVSNQYPLVQTVADHQALLASDIDCVVVATPIHTHFEVARDALQAGKHVLVEKPLTASVAQAVALKQLAEQRDRVLMVGHTFIFNPAVRALRKIVDGGRLGRIYYVDAARLNLGLFQQHADVIWDLAPHDISILLYILQSAPVMVSARGSACVRPGVHDVAYVEVQLDRDISTQIHVSWLDPCKVRRLTIVGDRKMAVYNDLSFAEKVRIYDRGVAPPTSDSYGDFQISYRHGGMVVPFIPWREPLRLQCEHFVRAVRTGISPQADAVQGIAVVAALEAASTSLANGGVRVPVSLPGARTAGMHDGWTQTLDRDPRRHFDQGPYRQNGALAGTNATAG